MSTRSGAASLALVLVLAGPPPSAAQDEAGSAAALAAALSPDSRVRAVDPAARRVLEAAVACSPTVARMVVALQSGDLVIGIETRPMPKKLLGEIRIVAATDRVRYARIGLRVPAGFPELVSVLGHELHHAMELAAAPGVRDLASQRAHYLAAGYAKLQGGYFETEGALEAGRRVASEIKGCAALR